MDFLNSKPSLVYPGCTFCVVVKHDYDDEKNEEDDVGDDDDVGDRVEDSETGPGLQQIQTYGKSDPVQFKEPVPHKKKWNVMQKACCRKIRVM